MRRRLLNWVLASLSLLPLYGQDRHVMKHSPHPTRGEETIQGSEKPYDGTRGKKRSPTTLEETVQESGPRRRNAVYSPCDLTRDGKVDEADVTEAKSMTRPGATCTTNDVYSDCNIVFVQRVANAEQTGICITGGRRPHAVILSWTSSTSPSVTGYNIYRGTQTGGPYSKLNERVIAGNYFTDPAVTAGQNYCYHIKTINEFGLESTDPNEACAVIPTP